VGSPLTTGRAPGGRRAVFLDRDGTINEEVGYLGNPDDLHLLPGAAGAIRRLNESGFTAIVVTNQSAIGRGYFSSEDVAAVNTRLVEQLRERGASIDGLYVCPHRPDERCSCRKPEPGLLLQAAEEHGLDVRGSFLVGDKESDLDSGRRAGCRTVLVRTGPEGPENAPPPDHVADDLAAAVEWILAAAG
jgi:D-glycero-D-manno-heptose 1,7-bisphosphate phosphatase